MLTVDELRRCELFGELTVEELRSILPLCAERSYPTGSTIFAAEERAEKLFILRDGNVSLQVRVQSETGADSETTLQVLQPGHVFGWSSVVKQQRFTATARVIEKADVICIEACRLSSFFDQHPHVGFVVMKQLANVISSRLRLARQAFSQQVGSQDHEAG